MDTSAASPLPEPPPVLLVEDDANDAFFMQRAFAHSALASRLFVVQDGLHATHYLLGAGTYADRLKYPSPGLLLLDLKMPHMNGFELLAWLQARPQFKNLPRVVISSSGQPADVQRAKALGADEYHVKSTNTVHLKKLVHELHTRWLNGHRKGDSPPSTTTVSS